LRARGCIPIVHDSGGPKEFIPTDYRYKNITEAIQKIEKYIREWSPSKTKEIRKITEKFNEDKFSKEFLRILRQYEENML